MSTNEFDHGAVTHIGEQNPRVAGEGAVPAGLPDVATLARLANEFFHGLPRDSAVAVAAVPESRVPIDPANASAILTPPVTPPTGPPEISLPSDPHFPRLPAGIGPASASPVTTPAPVTPPAFPGAMGATGPANISDFSFLQEARPLFAPESHGAQPYPQAKPITEFVPAETPTASLPFSLAEVSPPEFAQSSQPSSPTVPASFGFADSSAVPAFSFLEESRPLFSDPPSIPGPVPVAPDLQTPANAPGADAAAPVVPGTALHPQGKFPAGGRAEPSYSSRPSSSPTADSSTQPVSLERQVPEELDLSSYPFDAEALKRDFPILRERINGRPLVWLDNAATTQKPQSVIDRLKYFYEHENSNVHRAAHELAARATDAYESSREKTRRFLNASSSREIIFVRGATEGINLVAQSWGRRNVQKDDEIVITWLEHHANIVPWQMLCAEKGAKLRVAPVDDSGQIILDEYEKLLGSRTRLVSFPQVSNALGTVTPANAMVEAAHRHGAKVLVDGAQAVSHMRVDVQELDCDFYVFSGHKVFAPTGIGVVYGKPEVLEHMPPWQGGGNMIQDVTFEKTVYQPTPQRFEAGTGNIADAVGLGAAIDYLHRVGMENISRHEHDLLVYATLALQRIPGLHIIGNAKEKAGVLSFVLDGFKTEEVGDYLNRHGIAVRSGHHCAQPILRRFGLESTVRASLALYNTCADIDALVAALWNLRQGRGPGMN